MIDTIIKHGRFSAAKWEGHPEDRPYWEARYCGMQALYAEVTGDISAYSDFNSQCGITFENGHIIAADGTTCTDTL